MNQGQPSALTSTVTMETAAATCARCKRPFAYLALDEISEIAQLRIGTLLITSLEGNCLYCGTKFHWRIREKELKKIAATYGEILRKNGYMPE